MFNDIKERLDHNLDRVSKLLKLYEGLAGPGQGRRPVHSSDILRAATVLLHATLEDFMRSLERWLLPTAPDTALNGVPLASVQGHAQRFKLGDLAKHRGASVDEVIRESVALHLERKSYSSTTELCSVLTNLEIQTLGLEPCLPVLDELMRRRHHIVHQADGELRKGRGRQRARSIGRIAVQRWLEGVRYFTDSVSVFVSKIQASEVAIPVDADGTAPADPT